MAFQVKAVIPAKWGIDPRVFEREMRNAIDHTINIVDDDYGRTTRTWRRKPDFQKTRATRRAGGLRAQVATTSKVYKFVDLGTTPHIIRPKRRGGRLAFGTGGRAKTTPGVVGSRGGRRASGPKVFAKQVRHPGTKARKFTATIVQRRSRNARNLLRNALLKSLKRMAAVKA